MNYLIITAHPSTKGFTHKIAHAFQEEVVKNGHTCEIMDLYKEENVLAYLSFEDVRDTGISPQRDRFQAAVKNADQLVFVHPLWWGNMPAIMKNWIDVVFASGFAFRYTKTGPEGLLKGKSARVFVTGGSPWILYALLLFPFFIIWRLFVLGFCGIKAKSTTYFHNAPKITAEQQEKNLEKVRMIAKKG